MIDAVTQAWIRNRSDELAAAAGCRFDLERAEFVCNWIETNCRLYEGAAGPLLLRDWQREGTMRMFGWIRWSERLGRWIRRFTRGSIWVPKKNKKTPTSAAWALYLMCGDGEPGNHVFFAAKDGKQARLATKHAIEMRNASPLLEAETNLNLSEMKITHLPSKSDLAPLSSGDKKAAQAKQGLNGSVIIDETHVVSRQFVGESSIDRAGISRDEPLHIEISTAGKDPDGYGKAQYDYGKSVERGEVADHQFFFLCFEAPQSTSDEEIHADPIKFGRMANPAWGHTVNEEEFLADYHRSKRSLADFADWKTWRLNIWQMTATPWLRVEDWDACRAEFNAETMAGMSCCAGLDLAIRRDMSALAFVFPWESGRFRVLVFFFMPTGAIRRLAEHVPQVYEWVRGGWIFETPGATTDYRFIRECFIEHAGRFNVRKLIFDEYAAEQVTQEMHEATGVERLNFRQNAIRFNEPTQNLERAIIEHQFEHNGNPVLSWQIRHTNVQTEANGYIRPVKPPEGDHKKIDGVVATIMAFAGARLHDPEQDWFATGGGLKG